MPEPTHIDYSNEDIKKLINDILSEASQQGATHAEVDISIDKGFSVSSRKAEVESVEYNQDKAIDITVYFGKRTGSANNTNSS